MRCLILSAILASVPLAAAAQDPNDPNAKDPKKEAEFVKKVNAAIDKGILWIVNQYSRTGVIGGDKAELILLALFHGGLDKGHPLIVNNMNKLLSKQVNATYNAGLRGLLLEKVDRAKYQKALAELVLFFAQSQAKNGQWDYTGVGKAGPVPGGYAAPSKKKGPPKPGATQEADGEGPPPGAQIKAPPYKPGTYFSGDNSNTQYAVLGLFAAARANVEIPKAVLELAEKWFESTQNADGGWGYGRGSAGGSYGSMSTAGLTALIVTKFYLGKDWQSDPKVKQGLAWLGNNLKFDSNPGGDLVWQYYWIYGIERVGAITDLKEFGGHDWYREGAEYLISHQAGDGHWCDADPMNTAFAILFLRKATPALQKPADVATGGGKKQDEEKKDEDKKDEDKKDEPAK